MSQPELLTLPSLLTNPLIDTDSYKASHFKQYPPGTDFQFAYIESRGGLYDRTLFFGLQMILEKQFLRPLTVLDVEQANEFFKAHGEPFPYDEFMACVRDLGGYLPLHIKAIPEGTIVPTGIPLVTVETTRPGFATLGTFFETQLLRVWYPTTVATISWHIKQIIKDALERTGDPAGLPFKLHDFGSRGVSSRESAGLGGAAHLVNFMGSDTVIGVAYANQFYKEPMAGYSIPAAEHSTITSWGKEHEVDAYRNMLTQFAKPGSLVAVVSDSYNLFNAIDSLWGTELKQAVIDSGATVVIRPDSGVPHEIVLECLKRLDAKFGSTVNAKGYKVLNNVRVIQGDGINQESIKKILDTFIAEGYSADNVAFGMGGALLQQMNRDTQRFAMKCSQIHVAGEGFRDVFKAPATDPTKKSKAGYLDVVMVDGAHGRTFAVAHERRHNSILQTVFFEGILRNQSTFAEIRARTNAPQLF